MPIPKGDGNTLLERRHGGGTTIAGSDATFQINANLLTTGNYIFSLYSEDSQWKTFQFGNIPGQYHGRSRDANFRIFIAPTLGVDKSEVKRGDDIQVFGQTVPASDITVVVNSDQEYFGKTVADKNGIYLYNFDTTFLDYGTHSAKSKAAIANELVSAYGPVREFQGRGPKHSSSDNSFFAEKGGY